MMQVIFTHTTLTARRGRVIHAKCQAGRVAVPVEEDDRQEWELHAQGCLALMKKLGWTAERSGHHVPGGMVWTSLDANTPCVRG